VKVSKSGNTIYFNNKAFCRIRGIGANYFDIETGDEYWISGVKKDGQDRHWAGSGKVMIDRKIVCDYLKLIGKEKLNISKLEIIDIEDNFPVERVNKLLNRSEES